MLEMEKQQLQTMNGSAIAYKEKVTITYFE
jgi:hypothetical protein